MDILHQFTIYRSGSRCSPADSKAQFQSQQVLGEAPPGRLGWHCTFHRLDHELLDSNDLGMSHEHWKRDDR